MSISLIKLLNESHRADLIAHLTKQTNLTTETASHTIDSLIPTAVGQLVSVFRSNGVDAVLSMLSKESADSNWPTFNRAEVTKNLIQEHGISSEHAQTAINSVINATKTEVTGLLAHHSLSDILSNQSQFLEGVAPEWSLSLNGLTDLAGKGKAAVIGAAGAAVAGLAGLAGAAAAGLGSVGDKVGSVAGHLKDEAGELADKAMDGASHLADNVKEGAAHLADKAGDIAHNVKEEAAELAGKVGSLLGATADKVGNTAANIADGASDLAGKTADTVKDAGGLAAAGAAAGIAGVAGAAHAVGDKATEVGQKALHGAEKLGHTAAHAAERTVEKGSSLFKKLLPFIALAILALLAIFFFKQCQKTQPAPEAQPAPVAQQPVETAPVAPAPVALEAAKLDIETDGAGNVSAIAATVGSEEAKTKLLDAIKAQFGEEAANKASITVDPKFDVNFPGFDGFADLFAKLKGLPGSLLSIGSNGLTLSAADPVAAQSLLDGLKAKFPEGYNLTAAAVKTVEQKVEESISAAKDAMGKINPATSTAQELADALNIEIINFATGSSKIPASNQETLKHAADVIKQMPNAKLKVTGHTDNVGHEASNKKLSESRANAVRAFLIANGVAESQLSAEGMGSSLPKADNATESGRFSNRRIEFIAQ